MSGRSGKCGNRKSDKINKPIYQNQQGQKLKLCVWYDWDIRIPNDWATWKDSCEWCWIHLTH